MKGGRWCVSSCNSASARNKKRQSVRWSLSRLIANQPQTLFANAVPVFTRLPVNLTKLALYKFAYVFIVDMYVSSSSPISTQPVFKNFICNSFLLRIGTIKSRRFSTMNFLPVLLPCISFCLHHRRITTIFHAISTI